MIAQKWMYVGNSVTIATAASARQREWKMRWPKATSRTSNAMKMLGFR